MNNSKFDNVILESQPFKWTKNLKKIASLFLKKYKDSFYNNSLLTKSEIFLSYRTSSFLYYHSNNKPSNGMSHRIPFTWNNWLDGSMVDKASGTYCCNFFVTIILFPSLNILNIQETGANYSHKYIFLFMGGLFLPMQFKNGTCKRIT